MSLQQEIKVFDLSNVTSEKDRRLVKSGALSFLCQDVQEKVPSFDYADCEIVLPNLHANNKKNHNSQIVFGRDRHGNWSTGAGGKGFMMSGMIDLVAGRGQLIMANNKKSAMTADILEGISKVGPMFHSDAARVYITQRAINIDRYFGIEEQTSGPRADHTSAVAAKADHIRVIGREKVKIYAGKGDWDGFGIDGETNCLGKRISNPVIELQVGNRQQHPMVLGRNLVRYLKKKNKSERLIHKMLFQINTNLAIINLAISLIPGAAAATAHLTKMVLEDMTTSVSESMNTYLQELESLDSDLGITGQNHILSDSVFTT